MGAISGTVHVTVPALVAREQEPSGPRNKLAPSNFPDVTGWLMRTDGVIVNNATLSCNIKDGAKKANKESRMAVKWSMGVRYSVTNLDTASMMAENERMQRLALRFIDD